jgi:tellurite resistance protein TerC
MEIQTVAQPWMFGAFLAFVLGMLALDLGVFHKKAHSVSFREAAAWSAVWVTLALGFNAIIWQRFGSERGLEFLTGYVIEKALAVDNIFVFAVIFSYFAVPQRHQHRVLFWGILGALVMRAVFIGIGAALISRFHWVLYGFGVLLVYTGIKLLTKKEEPTDPGDTWVTRTFRRLVPMTDSFRDAKFWVRENGKWLATPLLLVLVLVEVSDVVFAVDSIPAIFAITEDPFIVFTSNIFAILGLRSMYFLLASVLERFHLLKIGLALVLCFVGAKMLIVDFIKLPIAVSLGVVFTLLLGSVGASVLFPRVPAEHR